MSQRDFRKRNIPANRRQTAREQKPSPLRKNSPSVKVKTLKRSKSEPLLWETTVQEKEVQAEFDVEEVDEGILYRPLTCTDIFSSSANLMPDVQPKCSEGYNKDAKVVVNVTVEGSPGPIRTMIKLGSNVEEMIKAVVNKYNEEGRTPRLDKNAASSCQLHYSNFSLEGLNKSDLIGDVGTRCFYLRKNNIGPTTSTNGSSNSDLSRVTSSSQLSPSTQFLQIFTQRNIKTILRKTRKIWRFFGCLTCTV